MKNTKYEDHGAIPLDQADNLNIPVNCLIVDPSDPLADDGVTQWVWAADNFMPRKGRVEEGQYEIHADTKEALLAAVREHVVPLYRAALHNLETKGENYFWEVEE